MATTVLTLLVLSGVPTGSASHGYEGPKYFERLVAEDSAGDFSSNGALDIVGLAVGEKFLYDFDRRKEIGPAIIFRITVEDMASVQNTVRYHVFFKVNGTEKDVWAEVSGQGDGCPCEGATAPMVSSSKILVDSVSMIVEASALGLSPGDSLTEVYAASSVAGGEARAYQDLAPGDNQQLPAGTNPSVPAGAGLVLVEGPYPFVRLEPKSPVNAYSVDGSEVRFDMDIIADDDLTGDLVFVFWDAPEGWEVEPSHGQGGAGAKGELSNFGKGQTVNFFWKASTSFPPAVGTVVNITANLYSFSGAKASVPVTIEMATDKIDTEDFVFNPVEPYAYDKDETVQVPFAVYTANGTPLPNALDVSVDLYFNGELIETVPATHDGNGTWTAEYSFPAEGAWIADVYISSLTPSPHKEFEVSIGSGGVLSPAPGLPLMLLGLLGAAFVALRRRR